MLICLSFSLDPEKSAVLPLFHANPPSISTKQQVKPLPPLPISQIEPSEPSIPNYYKRKPTISSFKHVSYISLELPLVEVISSISSNRTITTYAFNQLIVDPDCSSVRYFTPIHLFPICASYGCMKRMSLSLEPSPRSRSSATTNLEDRGRISEQASYK